jgi:hypothetical protein
MVEAEEKKDQERLVAKLAPALHQKRAGHFATSVQSVFFGRDGSRSDRIFHAAGRRHRILASDTYAVDEQ